MTDNPWSAPPPDPEPEAIAMPSPHAAAAEALSRRLKACASPILAGHEPWVQGMALAELTAMWLAGHDPELREQLFEMHMQAVHSLIEICEMEMFGPAGHPAG